MGIRTALSRLFRRAEHPERREHDAAAHGCCGGDSRGNGRHRHEAGRHRHKHEHGATQAKEHGHGGGSGCH